MKDKGHQNQLLAAEIRYTVRDTAVMESFSSSFKRFVCLRDALSNKVTLFR